MKVFSIILGLVGITIVATWSTVTHVKDENDVGGHVYVSDLREHVDLIDKLDNLADANVEQSRAISRLTEDVELMKRAPDVFLLSEGVVGESPVAVVDDVTETLEEELEPSNEFENQLIEEGEDPKWSLSAEGDIEDVIAHISENVQIQTLVTQCQSTLCKVEVQTNDIATVREFTMALNDNLAWSDGMYMNSYPQISGEILSKIFVFRNDR